MREANTFDFSLLILLSIIIIYTCSFSTIIWVNLTNTDYNDKLNILFILIICISTDIGGYIFGKIIGGKKLMPLISAGKTQSGLLTGILATLFSFYIYSTTINEFSIKYLFFVSIILLFAFLGDVIASIMKRLSSIKDSGSIMPGHGGLLDRLDSFLGVFFFIGILELLL